jgi:hypothetical protein
MTVRSAASALRPVRSPRIWADANRDGASFGAHAPASRVAGHDRSAPGLFAQRRAAATPSEASESCPRRAAAGRGKELTAEELSKRELKQSGSDGTHTSARLNMAPLRARGYIDRTPGVQPPRRAVLAVTGCDWRVRG